jgi:hypothetical protein
MARPSCTYPQWIVVAALVLLGTGVVAAVKATKQRDPAD